MERDYSQKMLNEMKGLIQEIDDEQICEVTDFVGDLYTGGKSLLGYLDAEDYTDNISKYHKQVLDQHDTSNAKLEKIFESVGRVDSERSVDMNQSFHTMNDCKVLLIKLTELLDPTKGSFTAKSIKENTKEAVRRLKEDTNLLDDVYREVLDDKAAHIAKKAAWEFVGDVLGFAGNVISFAAHLSSGNPAVIFDMWNTVDSFFALASDFSSLGIIGVGYFISGITNDEYYISETLREAEKLRDNDGLADVMRDEGWEAAADVVDTADTVLGIAEVVVDVKEGISDIKETKKILTAPERARTLNGLEKAEKARDIKITSEALGIFGFSYVKKDVRSVPNKLKKQQAIIKNVSNTYKWISAIASDDDQKVVENLLSYRKPIKIIKDVNENVEQYVTAWTE